MNSSSWPVETKTQVSATIQQQSGSHHSVSPEYVLSAAMVSNLVRCCSAVMMRASVQGFGFGFPGIEEQSMLAAKVGAKAKDRIRWIQIRARAEEGR